MNVRTGYVYIEPASKTTSTSINKLIRYFPDTDLRAGHTGLGDIARKNKILGVSLDYEGALTAKIIKGLSDESVRNTGR